MQLLPHRMQELLRNRSPKKNRLEAAQMPGACLASDRQEHTHRGASPSTDVDVPGARQLPRQRSLDTRELQGVAGSFRRDPAPATLSFKDQENS
jgi:hypothetical protein